MLPKTVLALAALALSPVEALWPVPVKSSLGDKTLWIDQTVAVTYNGKQLSYTAGYAPPSGRKFESQDIVQGGVARTFEAIFQKGLVPWMISEKGDDWEPATGGGNATRITKLAIEQTKEDDENNFKPLAGDVDESYSLSVGLSGEAKLKANSSIGVLRGLETFSQLFFQHSSGSSWYTQSAPVEIEDAPKYPHRGVLLDVARHWFEVDDIKRTIDGLAMNKMNVLHLHITDTQSWPLEVPALPRLHEVASYRKGMYYSTEEIASIYEYGVHRGVQVIMEIDMPGHVGIEEAYPGLTVAYKERPYQWYCAQPPCGSLKLNDTGVEDFLDTLFDDLLPRIAPYTAYFHTGGDEYKANNSLLDPALETADHEVLQPLLQRFLDHAHAKVREHGLVPFVWEEMVLEWNATLGEDVVIQSWLGNSAIKELAEAGHKVIDSSYEFYYLDCGRGQWLDFDNGAAFQEFYPFPDWCSPTKSWRLIYSRDPAEGVAPEAVKNVLGGELPVWTETIDPTSLDSIMWPRAGAAGEVWWSGRVDADGVNRTMYDARPRLSEQRERMLKRGIRGHPITQLWCDQNEVEDCAHVP